VGVEPARFDRRASLFGSQLILKGRRGKRVGGALRGSGRRR
jgi:hypothetical protein